MYGIIYLITNEKNGKQYVGQTTASLKQRWYSHVHFSKKKGYTTSVVLANAIRKYGSDQFSMEALCECETRAELDQKEKYFIKGLKTLVPHGYNLREGGYGGKHSPETIEKLKVIAQNRTPEHNANIAKSLKGRKIPDWHAEKLRESNRGRRKTAYELQRLRETKLGSLNPNYGKTGEKNSFYGKHHTEETKEKLRMANSKLDWPSVRKIRRLYRRGTYTMKQLAEDFGISAASVCFIVNQKTWKE